jgi:alkyl sulfatase BDS1-like metallo-beta-lactamase superfamily hydrolase
LSSAAILFLITLGLALTACGEKVDYDFAIQPGADAEGHSPPSEATALKNRLLQESLPFSDLQDFEDARRGLKETLFSDDLEVESSSVAVLRFFSKFDKPKGTFNIVIP